MKMNPIPFVIAAMLFLGTFVFSGGNALLAAQVLFGWLCFVGVVTLLTFAVR